MLTEKCWQKNCWQNRCGKNFRAPPACCPKWFSTEVLARQSDFLSRPVFIRVFSIICISDAIRSLSRVYRTWAKIQLGPLAKIQFGPLLLVQALVQEDKETLSCFWSTSLRDSTLQQKQLVECFWDQPNQEHPYWHDNPTFIHRAWVQAERRQNTKRW